MLITHVKSSEWSIQNTILQNNSTAAIFGHGNIMLWIHEAIIRSFEKDFSKVLNP